MLCLQVLYCFHATIAIFIFVRIFLIVSTFKKYWKCLYVSVIFILLLVLFLFINFFVFSNLGSNLILGTSYECTSMPEHRKARQATKAYDALCVRTICSFTHNYFFFYCEVFQNIYSVLTLTADADTSIMHLQSIIRW